MSKKDEIILKDQEVTRETLIKFLKGAGLSRSLNEAQTETFIEVCQAYGLNPFKREIHPSVYNNELSIVIGYEVYLKRAQGTRRLKSWKVWTEGSVDHGNILSSDLKAIIEIKFTDREDPFIWEVDFVEYVKFTKDGKPNKFWRFKPKTMIKKVAIGQGFRLGFPEELGGLPYLQEEIEEDIWTVAEQVKEDKEIVHKGLERMTEEANRQHEEMIAETAEEVEVVEVDPNEQLNAVKQDLLDAASIPDLVELWKQYPGLQTNEAFIQMFKSRKEEIEQTETQEFEPEVITPDLRSTNYGVDLARKLVRRCGNLAQLNQFADGEERKSVVKIIEECKDRFIQSGEIF